MFRHHDTALTHQLDRLEDAEEPEGRSLLPRPLDVVPRSSTKASGNTGLRRKGTLAGRGSLKPIDSSESNRDGVGAVKQEDHAQGLATSAQLAYDDEAVFRLQKDAVQVPETPTLHGTVRQPPERTTAPRPGTTEVHLQQPEHLQPTGSKDAPVEAADDFADNIASNYDPPPEIFEESNGHQESLRASRTDMKIKMSLDDHG